MDPASAAAFATIVSMLADAADATTERLRREP